MNPVAIETVKDSAYFCYCAYVLPISRYSGFLLGFFLGGEGGFPIGGVLYIGDILSGMGTLYG